MSEQTKVDVVAVLDAVTQVHGGIESDDNEFSMFDVDQARAAITDLLWKADTAATVLSNLIAARQVDARYGEYVTDLAASIARAGGAK